MYDRSVIMSFAFCRCVETSSSIALRVFVDLVLCPLSLVSLCIDFCHYEERVRALQSQHTIVMRTRRLALQLPRAVSYYLSVEWGACSALYACVYMCIHVCAYICLYGWLNGGMDVLMDGWMFVCMYGWMNGCTHICTGVCVCMYMLQYASTVMYRVLVWWLVLHVRPLFALAGTGLRSFPLRFPIPLAASVTLATRGRQSRLSTLHGWATN